MLNTYHDAVSGWLILASFFYWTKHSSAALCILRYALLKCSPEKLCLGTYLSASQNELIQLDFFRKMTTVQLLTFTLLERVTFQNPIYIQSELEMEGVKSESIVPLVDFARLLLFLCYYHLNNTSQCQDSLLDLQLTVE